MRACRHERWVKNSKTAYLQCSREGETRLILYRFLFFFSRSHSVEGFSQGSVTSLLHLSLGDKDENRKEDIRNRFEEKWERQKRKWSFPKPLIRGFFVLSCNLPWKSFQTFRYRTNKFVSPFYYRLFPSFIGKANAIGFRRNKGRIFLFFHRYVVQTESKERPYFFVLLWFAAYSYVHVHNRFRRSYSFNVSPRNDFPPLAIPSLFFALKK